MQVTLGSVRGGTCSFQNGAIISGDYRRRLWKTSKFELSAATAKNKIKPCLSRAFFNSQAYMLMLVIQKFFQAQCALLCFFP